MYHVIDSSDIAHLVAQELGDFPEIIVKKILDHQFKMMTHHVMENNAEIVKLDFIGKFKNGKREFYDNLKIKKEEQKIEEIFKDYTFK